jgi:hypothetical protein
MSYLVLSGGCSPHCGAQRLEPEADGREAVVISVLNKAWVRHAARKVCSPSPGRHGGGRERMRAGAEGGSGRRWEFGILQVTPVQSRWSSADRADSDGRRAAHCRQNQVLAHCRQNRVLALVQPPSAGL